MYEVIKMEAKIIIHSGIKRVLEVAMPIKYIETDFLGGLAGKCTQIFQRVKITGFKKLENFLTKTSLYFLSNVNFTQVQDKESLF